MSFIYIEHTEDNRKDVLNALTCLGELNELDKKDICLAHKVFLRVFLHQHDFNASQLIKCLTQLTDANARYYFA